MTLHATAIAIRGRAVLLVGPPGSGKSDLALRLIDRGAVLIADDRVVLATVDGRLSASPAATIAGLIEVRGVGIVAAPHAAATPVALLVDLVATPERLPEAASRMLEGHLIPLVAVAPHEASAALKVERALTAFGLGVEAASVTVPVPPDPAATELAEPASASARILLLTGMSGAGRSTALKALEDMGYEAVDNLPLSLFDKLLATSDDGPGATANPAHAAERPLAIGIDARTRGFDADAIVARVRGLRAEPGAMTLVFLDCSDVELTRRFSETRRRHPVSHDGPAADGIARERSILAPLRRVADIVIDTSDYAVPDLRRALAARFARPGIDPLTLTVMSFGFARGLPRDADLVFDMRFLANPHWDPELRPLTGEDPAVGAYVAADPAFTPAFDQIANLLVTLLPRYGAEGKSYLTVAFGCTGGRHRSVYVADRMAERLADAGWLSSVYHRDITSTAAPGDNAALPGPAATQTP